MTVKLSHALVGAAAGAAFLGATQLLMQGPSIIAPCTDVHVIGTSTDQNCVANNKVALVSGPAFKAP